MGHLQKIAGQMHWEGLLCPLFCLKLQTGGYFAVRGHLGGLLELLLRLQRYKICPKQSWYVIWT
jgi:hypothetical protein